MKIKDTIKVQFPLRGELNREEFSGDSIQDLIYNTDPDLSPDLKGIAETPWGEVVSFDREYVIVKMLNRPIFQIDEKTGKKLEKGDICKFKLKGRSKVELKKNVFSEYERKEFPEFVELIDEELAEFK